MKILYLTFYYEPDLCAGSFRNTPIIEEISNRPELCNGQIDVITTMPNRYSTYKVGAKRFEKKNNINVYRIDIPNHKSGFLDQILSFLKYFFQAIKISRNESYDIVVASSSRLFTAFLGAYIAKRKKIPLYLDIRDLFRETITEIVQNRVLSCMLNFVCGRVENYTFGNAQHINLVSEGFRDYFNDYTNCSYSYFTNGIDEIFIDYEFLNKRDEGKLKKVILYAGNIGEGQGLHAILPAVAFQLQEDYEFVIIGDGGAKLKLKQEIEKHKIQNIKIMDPMSRNELLESYNAADFLFVHLNNLKAFDRVLPSKIFEYAAFSKPIIAGLSGFSYNFMKQNVENIVLFHSCNKTEFLEGLRQYEYKEAVRNEFIKKYRRRSINKSITKSIIDIV